MRLARHVQRNHPTDDNLKPFSIWEEIGYLPLCNCCFRRRENETGEDEIEIPQISQQLGLGASLFLMATKALAWLFFYLSLINIPTLAFYHSGNESMKTATSNGLNATTDFLDDTAKNLEEDCELEDGC